MKKIFYLLMIFLSFKNCLSKEFSFQPPTPDCPSAPPAVKLICPEWAAKKSDCEAICNNQENNKQSCIDQCFNACGNTFEFRLEKGIPCPAPKINAQNKKFIDKTDCENLCKTKVSPGFIKDCSAICEKSCNVYV